jgi:transposase-like protein
MTKQPTLLEIFWLAKTLPEFKKKQLAAMLIADTLNSNSMFDTAELINNAGFNKKNFEDIQEECDNLDNQITNTLQ